MMEERMKKQILHAAALLMLAFGVLMAYVTYLMTFQSEALALHPLNPRSSVGEDHIWRGSLLCWMRKDSRWRRRLCREHVPIPLER